MKPEDYNQAELVAGRLTMAHITWLVRFYQTNKDGAGDLAPDGMFGPKTRASLERRIGPAPATVPFLAWPLPVLSDGRRPYITSSFKPADRPNHVGLDMFYEFKLGDRPDFIGDRGGAGKGPKIGDRQYPKHVVPFDVTARAAGKGKVQIAGNSPTGYRIWIDHGNGWRTGYFHLLNLYLNVGDTVLPGTPLGLVGDNPKDHDGRHLHFELSPVDRYAPQDPEPYLVKP